MPRSKKRESAVCRGNLTRTDCPSMAARYGVCRARVIESILTAFNGQHACVCQVGSSSATAFNCQQALPVSRRVPTAFDGQRAYARVGRGLIYPYCLQWPACFARVGRGSPNAEACPAKIEETNVHNDDNLSDIRFRRQD